MIQKHDEISWDNFYYFKIKPSIFLIFKKITAVIFFISAISVIASLVLSLFLVGDLNKTEIKKYSITFTFEEKKTNDKEGDTNDNESKTENSENTKDEKNAQKIEEFKFKNETSEKFYLDSKFIKLLYKKTVFFQFFILIISLFFLFITFKKTNKSINIYKNSSFFILFVLIFSIVFSIIFLLNFNFHLISNLPGEGEYPDTSTNRNFNLQNKILGENKIGIWVLEKYNKYPVDNETTSSGSLEDPKLPMWEIHKFSVVFLKDLMKSSIFFINLFCYGLFFGLTGLNFLLLIFLFFTRPRIDNEKINKFEEKLKKIAKLNLIVKKIMETK